MPQHSDKVPSSESFAIVVVLAVDAWWLPWHEALAVELHARDWLRRTRLYRPPGATNVSSPLADESALGTTKRLGG